MEIKATAHTSTILSQITSLFSKHDFERLANKYHRGQKFRSCTRWSQFIAMTFAQLSRTKVLSDLVANLDAQRHLTYHLGMIKTSRATLARVNEQQPYELYKELFISLLRRCQSHAPRNRFKPKDKLYLIDATTIDLSLVIFPWPNSAGSKVPSSHIWILMLTATYRHSWI